MKKYRFLIISIVVLALLITAYFIVINMNKGEEEVVEEQKEEIVVIDETNDTVTTIAYKNSYGTVNFNNMTGIWTYTSDQNMPVSQSFVNEMASKLSKVTATREIDTKQNESDYGFDSPTLELTVGTRGGNVHSFIVGALNPVSDNYYLKYDDKIFMIDSTIVTATNYELFAALDTQTFPTIAAEDIISVTVNGKEANKDGYASLSVGVAENYKDAENYGFDGTENKVIVKYNEAADITDEAGNVTSSVKVEKEFSFSYVTKDSEHFIMFSEDPIIYRGLGIEALSVTEESAE